MENVGNVVAGHAKGESVQVPWVRRVTASVVIAVANAAKRVAQRGVGVAGKSRAIQSEWKVITLFPFNVLFELTFLLGIPSVVGGNVWQVIINYLTGLAS